MSAIHSCLCSHTLLQGYSSQKAFIIAQTPMNHSANDFWKMILDYKASGIITCSEDFEEEVSSLIIVDVIESRYSIAEMVII